MDINLLGSSGFAAVAVFSLMLQYGGGSQAASSKAKQLVKAEVALIEANPERPPTLRAKMRHLPSAMPDELHLTASATIITEAMTPPTLISSPASVSNAILTSTPGARFRAKPATGPDTLSGTQLTPLSDQILATITGEMLDRLSNSSNTNSTSNTNNSSSSNSSNSSSNSSSKNGTNTTFSAYPYSIENKPSATVVAEITVPITMPDAYFFATAIDEPVEKSANKRVKLLTSFATPQITSFLNPAGFVRESWQKISKEPVVGTPLNAEPRFVIMLDPGHGGTDPGAEAHNGLVEKDLTLDIARRARLFLSEYSEFNVLLTRDHDHGLSRQSRVNAIARSQADLVVSLHFNHLPQTDITLVESFYAGQENIAESLATRNKPHKRVSARPPLDFSFTKGSERLAHTLQQRVFSEVSLDNPTAANAGVKKETLFVLTRSFTPGVLIELTPLSNVDEAEKLKTEEYRNRLAAALVDGIRMYKESLEHSPLDTQTDIGA